MRVTEPCTIDFYGCMWDEGWEYDAPAVIYSPVKRYTPNAHNAHAIIELAESIACDLVCEIPVMDGFHASDLKEFAWRGWNKYGFARRKNAWHIRVRVKFFRRDGEMHFDIADVYGRFGMMGRWTKVKLGGE